VPSPRVPAATCRAIFERALIALRAVTPAIVAAALVLAVAAVGCGPFRPIVVPASGIVTLDGEPLPGGFVRVVPAASRPATGAIGPDGRFTLGTFAEADGCVPGTLGVEVIGPLPRGCEMAPVAATPAVTVPDRYRTADTSGLTITVTRATTDLVIALSSDNQPPTTRDWTRSAAVFTRGLLWAGLTRARSAPVGRARRTARVERLRRCQGRAWKATARVQRS